MLIDLCLFFAIALMTFLFYRVFTLQKRVEKMVGEYNDYYFSRLNNVDTRFNHFETRFLPVYNRYRTMVNGEVSLKNNLQAEIATAERHIKLTEDHLQELITQLKNRIEKLEVGHKC